MRASRMSRRLLRSIGGPLTAAAIAACGRNAAPVSAPPNQVSARELAEQANEGDAEERIEPTEETATPTAIGGGPTDLDTDDVDIAHARCEHLSRCGGVGNARGYESIGACLAASRAAIRQEISSSTCGALRPGAAAACALAWRTRACGTALGLTPDACKREQMCR